MIKSFGKSLTFEENFGEIKCSNISKKEIFGTIKSNTAFITTLESDVINTTKLNCEESQLSNISYFYDKDTNITYIQNLSDNIVVKTKGEIISLRILNSGDILVENNLHVSGNIEASNVNLAGDMSAVNANLLGDLTSTNGYITNQLIIDRNLMALTAKIGDLQVDGCLNVCGQIQSSFIEAGDMVKSIAIDTPNIISQLGITMMPSPDHTVNIPNVRYNTMVLTDGTIGPTIMKAAKIFIVTSNVMLQADETCDGIEIIIFNNRAAQIIVRDSTTIICKLEANCSKSMVFSCAINKWI